MTRFRKAAHAYEAFTGRAPSRVKRAKLDSNDVTGWEMGPAVGIAYEAVRDGSKAQYFHEFSKSARPNLIAREDGRQLYLSGGNYTVTDRGVEDMPELFIVNPSRRRGAASSKRKTAVAATKRNRKGQFVKGGGAAPRKRRSGARTRQVAVFHTNPAPKRRRRRSALLGAARAAPKRRRFRRNPSGRKALGGLMTMIIPAAGVGAGAVGSEILMGYLPIPASWKSGVARQVTKGAVGVAAGWLLSTLLRQKKLGFYVSAGAIVIAVHDGIKEALTARLPATATAAAFGQYVTPLAHQFAGAPQLGAMPRRGGLGYVNPALTQRFGQYVKPLAHQFAGAGSAFDQPGGETHFHA